MITARHPDTQTQTPEEAHAEYVKALRKVNDCKKRKETLARLTDMMNELNTPNL